MPPTTFDEIVKDHYVWATALQKQWDELEAQKDALVAEAGVDLNDDPGGLRWLKEGVEKYEELRRQDKEHRRQIEEKKAEVQELKRVAAENMACYEKIMKLLGRGISKDPELAKGLYDIVRAHDSPNVEVVGSTSGVGQEVQGVVTSEHNKARKTGGLLEMVKEAVSSDPWMLKGVQDIVRAYCETSGGAWLAERESLPQTLA
jgi:cell division protein FtsB